MDVNLTLTVPAWLPWALASLAGSQLYALLGGLVAGLLRRWTAPPASNDEPHPLGHQAAGAVGTFWPLVLGTLLLAGVAGAVCFVLRRPALLASWPGRAVYSRLAGG